jgi:hypothetical protein
MSRQSQNVVNIWKDEIVGLFTGERMRARRLRCEAFPAGTDRAAN